MQMNEEEKKKIAVVGRSEFTLGFRLAGVQKIYGRDNYRENIEELLDADDVGIVVMEEDGLDDLPKRIQNEVERSVDPVFVPLSETSESERLNEKIKRAIGADITP